MVSTLTSQNELRLCFEDCGCAVRVETVQAQIPPSRNPEFEGLALFEIQGNDKNETIISEGERKNCKKDYCDFFTTLADKQIVNEDKIKALL